MCITEGEDTLLTEHVIYESEGVLPSLDMSCAKTPGRETLEGNICPRIPFLYGVCCCIQRLSGALVGAGLL